MNNWITVSAAKLIEKTSNNIDIEESVLKQGVVEWMIRDERKKQENIVAIIAQAARKLNQHLDLEKMDNDWVKYFFNTCKCVSDKDMQALWSDILSNEANTPGVPGTPGHYLKNTLEFMALLNKEKWDKFTLLCNFVALDIETNELHPLILDIEDGIYSELGYGCINELEQIGLIERFSSCGFTIKKDAKNVVFNYYGRTTLNFRFGKESGNTLPIGQVKLTEYGKQLAPLCASKQNESFMREAVKYYKNNGDVAEMTIGSI